MKVAQASRIWVSFEGKNLKNALKWSFHWNLFYFFCNSMDLHLHNNINTLQSVSFLRNHFFLLKMKICVSFPKFLYSSENLLWIRVKFCKNFSLNFKIKLHFYYSSNKLEIQRYSPKFLFPWIVLDKSCNCAESIINMK